MKLNFKLFILSIFSFPYFNAQVGVGTTSPNASALLDVSSTDKGFLLPRVNLISNTDNTTILAPATALMAYNFTSSGNILGNRVYVWRGSVWDSFSNLPEIKFLKVPVDFARVSKSTQLLSVANLTSINTGSVVPIDWASGDVEISNPNDVLADSTPNIKILTSSFYQFSGTFTVKANTISNTSTTNVVVLLQSSSDNGGTWTDVVSAGLPLEEYAVNKNQSLVFPNIVHHLNANDLVRFVISRPSGVIGTTIATYLNGSGIVSRLTTDVTRSIRITRLTE